MKWITLLTDFGERDGYPAAMKGAIWQVAPDAQIVDITHEVAPQDVLEAMLTLSRVYPCYPKGTVHVAVVDPGVGTLRRPLALMAGEAYFVGPDNGIFTLPIRQAQQAEQTRLKIVVLDQPAFWRSPVSPTFHGRDLFAPAAAHLANGVPLETLGTPISDPVLLDLPAVEVLDDGWRGQVIHIDRFGNLATSIRAEMLSGVPAVEVAFQDEVIFGLCRTYGEAPPGALLALIDSAGFLSIAIRNGSAAQRFGACLGAPVEVYPVHPRPL